MTVMYLLRIQNTSFEHEKLCITEVMCKIRLLIKGCSRQVTTMYNHSTIIHQDPLTIQLSLLDKQHDSTTNSKTYINGSINLPLSILSVSQTLGPFILVFVSSVFCTVFDTWWVLNKYTLNQRVLLSAIQQKGHGFPKLPWTQGYCMASLVNSDDKQPSQTGL